MGIYCENRDGFRFGTEVHYRIKKERHIFVLRHMNPRHQSWHLDARIDAFFMAES